MFTYYFLTPDVGFKFNPSVKGDRQIQMSPPDNTNIRKTATLDK